MSDPLKPAGFSGGIPPSPKTELPHVTTGNKTATVFQSDMRKAETLENEILAELSKRENGDSISKVNFVRTPEGGFRVSYSVYGQPSKVITLQDQEDPLTKKVSKFAAYLHIDPAVKRPSREKPKPEALEEAIAPKLDPTAELMKMVSALIAQNDSLVKELKAGFTKQEKYLKHEIHDLKRELADSRSQFTETLEKIEQNHNITIDRLLTNSNAAFERLERWQQRLLIEHKEEINSILRSHKDQYADLLKELNAQNTSTAAQQKALMTLLEKVSSESTSNTRAFAQALLGLTQNLAAMQKHHDEQQSASEERFTTLVGSLQKSYANTLAIVAQDLQKPLDLQPLMELMQPVMDSINKVFDLIAFSQRGLFVQMDRLISLMEKLLERFQTVPDASKKDIETLQEQLTAIKTKLAEQKAKAEATTQTEKEEREAVDRATQASSPTDVTSSQTEAPPETSNMGTGPESMSPPIEESAQTDETQLTLSPEQPAAAAETPPAAGSTSARSAMEQALIENKDVKVLKDHSSLKIYLMNYVVLSLIHIKELTITDIDKFCADDLVFQTFATTYSKIAEDVKRTLKTTISSINSKSVSERSTRSFDLSSTIDKNGTRIIPDCYISHRVRKEYLDILETLETEKLKFSTLLSTINPLLSLAENRELTTLADTREPTINQLETILKQEPLESAKTGTEQFSTIPDLLKTLLEQDNKISNHITKVARAKSKTFDTRALIHLRNNLDKLQSELKSYQQLITTAQETIRKSSQRTLS